MKIVYKTNTNFTFTINQCAYCTFISVNGQIYYLQEFKYKTDGSCTCEVISKGKLTPCRNIDF